MRIIRKSCARGAGEAEGLAVVIDVFRAFTCAPLFFHFGAKKVLLEADPEEARVLKREHPEYVLVGEINEVPLEDADLGNSPSEIVLKGRSFFRDRVVIHRTTAGVTGVRSAMDTADEVVLGSFLMARTVADYIRTRNPEVVTLVAMGDRALNPAPEDEACADYLEHLLTGKSFDPVRSLEDVLFQPTAQKFIQGTKPYLPREDPVFCLQRDLFDFILCAGWEDTQLVVTVRTRSSW
ncbi:MAG: 2-phosphosulfolactate phosphatase [Deltaproteobacteria bacterium]|nr:2-phosphosulfolactate phosphatase [Deltaproteobacteria bacterium]